jgi:hypothetical protein
MQPDFEKSNEIYFRLGIIYKQQQKYQSSLEVLFPTARAWLSLVANKSAVFPIHCFLSTDTFN